MGETKNEFEELEHDLREGLAARAAPAGFARKVMARIQAQPVASATILPWRRAAAAAAVAAALLALVAGSQWEHQREQRIAGERARDQVILALRITGSTLDAVQQKIQRTGKEIHP